VVVTGILPGEDGKGAWRRRRGGGGGEGGVTTKKKKQKKKHCSTYQTKTHYVFFYDFTQQGGKYGQ
jgi:hypothetical protein